MQPRRFNQVKIRRPHPTFNNELRFNWDLTKYISFVTPILIMLGVLRVYFYYLNFNVNIFDYMELTEVITSLLDLLIYTIIVYAFMLFYFPLGILLLGNWSKKTQIIVLLAWYLLPITFVYFYTNALRTGYTIPIIGFGLFASLIPFIQQVFQDHKTGLTKKGKHIMIISYYILLTAGIMYLVAKTDVRNVKRYGKFVGVKVNYKDGGYFISDSNRYFIGKTSNYIFIYNQLLKNVKIETIEDVQSIEVPRWQGVKKFLPPIEDE